MNRCLFYLGKVSPLILRYSTVNRCNNALKQINIRNVRTFSTQPTGSDPNKPAAPKQDEKKNKIEEEHKEYWEKNQKQKSVAFFVGVSMALIGILTIVSKRNKKHKKSGSADKVATDDDIKPPSQPKMDLPPHIPYLLIGAGTASYHAYLAIRGNDPTAKILMLSEENHVPYARPPLSKQLWVDKEKESMALKFLNSAEKDKSLPVYFEAGELYFTDPKKLLEEEKGGVAVAFGRKVVKIDAVLKIAYMNDGTEIKFDKCLIATGGKPKTLPILEKAPIEVRNRVNLFRNIEDFRRLEKRTEKASSVAVIGGGFLGSELACALGSKAKSNNMKVYQIFQEPGVLGRVLPRYLSRWTSAQVQAEGVETIANSKLSSISFKDGKLQLSLDTGKDLAVDQLVVAVGIEPSVELAKSSGLELDDKHGGLRVNAELEARSNIWAAGDASCFYDIKLGRRRVEHHDHAVVSGRLAGRNMTGDQKPYHHQSMFWSDVGPNVSIDAVGIIDATLPTTAVFAKSSSQDKKKVEAKGENFDEPEKKSNNSTEVTPIPQPTGNEDFDNGVVFYQRDNTVVGIAVLNMLNKMRTARQILRDGAEGEDLYEVAKLFYTKDDEEDAQS